MKVPFILGCIAATSLFVGTAAVDHAAIIFQDAFSGSSSKVLTGTKPAIDTTGSAWTLRVSGEDWLANGAAPATSEYGSDEHLATTFTNGNIYTLSATISPNPGTTGNWFILGFLDGSYYGNSTTVGPSMVITDKAGWQLYTGEIPNTLLASGSGVTLGQTGEIILNTGGPQWTAQWLYDGVSLGTYTYATAPALDGVGIGAYGNQQGTMSNFELQVVAAPEPTTLTLGSIGCIGGLLLIRRRKSAWISCHRWE